MKRFIFTLLCLTLLKFSTTTCLASEDRKPMFKVFEGAFKNTNIGLIFKSSIYNSTNKTGVEIGGASGRFFIPYPTKQIIFARCVLGALLCAGGLLIFHSFSPKKKDLQKHDDTQQDQKKDETNTRNTGWDAVLYKTTLVIGTALSGISFAALYSISSENQLIATTDYIVNRFIRAYAD